MELVEWSELSDGQHVTFRRYRRERRLDPVDEARSVIVLADLSGGIGHNASPGKIVDWGAAGGSGESVVPAWRRGLASIGDGVLAPPDPVVLATPDAPWACPDGDCATDAAGSTAMREGIMNFIG
jgi:hypothetical protein